MAGWRWRNVPLPESHLGGLGIGILLHVFIPWTLFPRPWMGHAAGWPLVVGGVALSAWSVRAAAELDIERPEALIEDGPYARSRNPMYVAWTLAYIGISLVVNTAWPVVLVPAVVLLIHATVVREERDLERRFGDRYDRYRSRVRRYL